MDNSCIHNLSSFTQITIPVDEKRVDTAPYMDYDNTQEEDIEDDDDYDYDDYNDISDDKSSKAVSLLT